MVKDKSSSAAAAAAAAAASTAATALASTAAKTATDLALTVSKTATDLAVATAVMANSIENIKDKITSIESSLKTMVDQQNTKEKDLDDKVDSLATLVNRGVGIAITISVLLPLILKFVLK